MGNKSSKKVGNAIGGAFEKVGDTGLKLATVPLQLAQLPTKMLSFMSSPTGGITTMVLVVVGGIVAITVLPGLIGKK
jgi:hypothetical protein